MANDIKAKNIREFATNLIKLTLGGNKNVWNK